MKETYTLFTSMERIVMGHLCLRVIKLKEPFVRTLEKKSTCNIIEKMVFLSVIKNTEVTKK